MARPVVHRTVTWSTTTEQLTPGNTRAVAVVGDAHADTTVVLSAGPKLLCHAQHNAQAHKAHASTTTSTRHGRGHMHDIRRAGP